MSDIQFMEEQIQSSHSYSSSPQSQSLVEKIALYFHIPKQKIPQALIALVAVIVLVSLFILYSSIVPKKAATTPYPRGYEANHQKATLTR